MWADWACAMQLLSFLAADPDCPAPWKDTVLKLREIVFPADGLAPPDKFNNIKSDLSNIDKICGENSNVEMQWKLEDFVLVKLLGQGAYGKVS